MLAFFRQRIAQPLVLLFRQGLTPRKIALCLVLGASVSVFPVLGTTTLSCTALAIWLKLNLPAIQAVNWLCAGAQLVLIVPFMRLGEFLFRDPPLPLAPAELAEAYNRAPLSFLRTFRLSIVHAVCGWAVIVVPLALIAYPLLVVLLGRRHSGRNTGRGGGGTSRVRARRES
jgi:uncharacterized protein (DUF2062 family)